MAAFQRFLPLLRLHNPNSVDKLIGAKLILHRASVIPRTEYAGVFLRAAFVSVIIEAVEHQNAVAPFGVARDAPVSLPEPMPFDCQPFCLAGGNPGSIQCNRKIVRDRVRVSRKARGCLRQQELPGYVVDKRTWRRRRAGDRKKARVEVRRP